ncbi:hypothetical protein H4R99_008640 [Coemansia sp. RSA 1722]|nr:hypothetical protein H4R99_008640 [Coemansia sp. RSA 1722]
MSAVFACQGFGNLAASIVAIVVLACFKSAIREDVFMLDYVWRICLGFGAIPGGITLYWRLTMPESKSFQAEANKRAAAGADAEAGALPDTENEMLLTKNNNIQTPLDEQLAESSRNASNLGALVNDKYAGSINHIAENADATEQPTKTARLETFGQYFGQWKNMKVLLGTSLAWFVVDVAFYGINLNSSVVISAIGFSGDVQSGDPYDVLTRNCLGNIIINVLGSVPGYWISVFTIEKLGRKWIQLMGFAALTVLYVVIGFAYHKILDASNVAFIVLFTLAQLFQNFGPNVTCFVWPGEVFPTRFKATAHGISAASGKLGAIVAQAGLMTLKDRGGPNEFIPHLIEIFALFTLVGFFVTFWIPESKGKTIEEITGETD